MFFFSVTIEILPLRQNRLLLFIVVYASGANSGYISKLLLVSSVLIRCPILLALYQRKLSKWAPYIVLLMSLILTGCPILLASAGLVNESISNDVIVSKLGWHTIVCKFDLLWVLLISGLVLSFEQFLSEYHDEIS